jgi:type III pantothenate kinase
MLPVNPEGGTERWCALVAGNSRLHWAMFSAAHLEQRWDVPHPRDTQPPQQWSDWERHSPALAAISHLGGPWPPLWMVSVVPSQTQFWQTYPGLRLVERADIPLGQMYASLGCDRALAVWAAGQIYGFPVLVIDGGTALTLTGANAQGDLVGGAILPGVGLQLRSLTSATALPTVESFYPLPSRWAKNTTEAMLSGVLHTIRAGVSDFLNSWCLDFPQGKVVLTGGDAPLLYRDLQAAGHKQGSTTPFPWQNRLVCDETLIFQGIHRLRIRSLASPGSNNQH